MNKKQFILTKDAETAEKLLDTGFRLLSQSNQVWYFANCQALCFSKDIDISKIAYTNKFCV